MIELNYCFGVLKPFLVLAGTKCSTRSKNLNKKYMISGDGSSCK